LKEDDGIEKGVMHARLRGYKGALWVSKKEKQSSSTKADEKNSNQKESKNRRSHGRKYV
jgi:hypothetical protein